MSRPKLFVLAHAEARGNAMRHIAAAPDGYCVRVSPPKRSGEQNAKFHAICTDLAGTLWAGQARDADAWKVLLVSGHAVATKPPGEVVPGLEGEFVSIRESTATMTKQRGASLIEYAEAIAAMYGKA